MQLIVDMMEAPTLAAPGPVGSPPVPLCENFLYLISSIGDQFEFLHSSWADSPSFPAENAGPDPVIGTGGSCLLSLAAGTTTTVTVDNLISIEGALYAFTPSLTTLMNLASGTELPSNELNQVA